MALDKEALAEDLANVGIQSDLLGLLNTLDTAASALGALGSLIPSIDAAIVIAQQAAITAAMGAVSSLALKFAPKLLDLTGEILAVMADPLDFAVTQFNSLIDPLDIRLPDVALYSLTAVSGLINERIIDPALDVAETIGKLSSELPGNILSGQTGGFSKNPYDVTGKLMLNLETGIAFLKGKPPRSPAKPASPEDTSPSFQKEMPQHMFKWDDIPAVDPAQIGRMARRLQTTPLKRYKDYAVKQTWT